MGLDFFRCSGRCSVFGARVYDGYGGDVVIVQCDEAVAFMILVKVVKYRFGTKGRGIREK